METDPAVRTRELRASQQRQAELVGHLTPEELPGTPCRPKGLAETLTVMRLGVPPTLARTLRSTNSIESMIEACRDHAANARALAGRADGAALDRRRDGEARRQFRRASVR